MTREDIIRMAQVANLPACHTTHPKALERFAKLVEQAQRDRLHDKFMAMHEAQKHSNNYWHFAARQIKENK